ncbi:unnamed protein product, partial [Sphacelaria rigidula]
QVADTIVGDEKTRGISGGEKKRLSIACQLFGTPSLIFCDEPTSGLDSFQAERVMSTLRELAENGHTVVCSIHQPRSSIFRMFDDLLVLSEGQVMFHGPADRAVGYFRSKGFSMPANTNPGEFAIDVVSIDYTSKVKRNKEIGTGGVCVCVCVEGAGADSFSSGRGTSTVQREGLHHCNDHDGSMKYDENYDNGCIETEKDKEGDIRVVSLTRKIIARLAAASSTSCHSSYFSETPTLAGLFHGGGKSGAPVSTREKEEGNKKRFITVPTPTGLLRRGHGRRGRAGPLEQFRLLLARSWRQVNRAKFANITRV